MLKFRLRKTILGNLKSLGEILDFTVLPFVKLHHFGHIFFSCFNPFRPGFTADPTHSHLIRLPAGDPDLGGGGGDKNLLVTRAGPKLNRWLWLPPVNISLLPSSPQR